MTNTAKRLKGADLILEAKEDVILITLDLKSEPGWFALSGIR